MNTIYLYFISLACYDSNLSGEINYYCGLDISIAIAVSGDKQVAFHAGKQYQITHR